jgi:ring-1,2-phenylacetyl-CoA epoxidase subunit PaaC
MTAVSTGAAPAGESEIDPRLALVLALGDDELVIGHRHSQWTGVAPHLEEDLALSSIAQDEIGHAVLWYSIAAGVAGTDPDTLGLGRPAGAYRHAILLERENRDWAYSLARHYLYDTADDVRLRALAASDWGEVAEATGALLREERYHLMHARAWLTRLADGPIDARQRLADGLAEALRDALGLFEPLPGEPELVASGVLPAGHDELLQRWLDGISADLERVGLERVLESGTSPPSGELVATASGEMAGAAALVHPHVVHSGGVWAPVGEFSGRGGRYGRHGEDWLPLWEEMTATYREHPGARW